MIYVWAFLAPSLGFLAGVIYKTWADRRRREWHEHLELCAAMRASIQMYEHGRKWDMPLEDWARLHAGARIGVTK